jgi:predicted amidohydrolase
VALAQLRSGEDVEQNLRTVEAVAAEAHARGAQWLALPENFAYLGPEASKHALAEPVVLDPGAPLAGPPAECGNGPIVQRLCNAAKRYGLTLLCGGFPERRASAEQGPPYNTAFVLSPDGAVLHRYRKLHLFDVRTPDGSVYAESAGTSAGDASVPLAPLALDGFRLGTSICYDVRFPELYRQLAAAGADVLFVPAAFTVATGKDHWHVLLRARAIENQCYVLAPAQWGVHSPTRSTYGKSLVADPWGDVIVQASDGQGIALADLRLGEVTRVREAMPCLNHRRL